MQGISIRDHDSSGVLSFDLKDLLRLLPERGVDSVWIVKEVECVGDPDACEKLLRAAADGRSIAGGEMLRVCEDIDQVIDGQFIGIRVDESEPWIVIRAVDSSAYDVETDRSDVLERLRARFDLVDEIPQVV